MAHAFTYRSDSTGSFAGVTKAKATAWFQLHPRNWVNPSGKQTGFFGRPEAHMDFLKAFDGELWLQEEMDELPNGKRYPLDEIVRAAGRTHFTSTFAYQLGLMWYQHVVEKRPIEKLVVYGVNLTSMDEYVSQKPCVEYWLGRLEEAGVVVDIPRASALLKGRVYAMQDDDISDHAFERLQGYKTQFMKNWANTNTAQSMRIESQFWAGKLSGLADKFPESFTDKLNAEIQSIFDKRAESLSAMEQNATSEIGKLLGKIQSEQHWLAITGGIDYRAPALPDLHSPIPQLAGDFEVPKPQAI